MQKKNEITERLTLNDTKTKHRKKNNNTSKTNGISWTDDEEEAEIE